MSGKFTNKTHTSFGIALAFGLLMVTGCSRGPMTGVKKMPSGQELSGFLKDYNLLQKNPRLEGDALTFVNPDKAKGLRRYVAVIVDPVEVYIATDAAASAIPARTQETVSNYFRHALIGAVADAFPVVDSPGPLVLRLRAAVVGIDAGGAVAPISDPALTAKPLERAVVLEKVGVEMELLDSETGERVAAMVDRTKLGAGADVGDENFSRVARFRQAKQAFDEWAARVRVFLDSEHELTGEDALKAEQAYRPYGQ